MPQFVWQDLVDRARLYLDDDDDSVPGWIRPEKWLSLANAEYAHLYKRWARCGLVAPPYLDTRFSTPTVVIPRVLAIVGVAVDTGAHMRVLQPAQSAFGRVPFWRSPSEPAQGLATRWAAAGISDTVTITVDPPASASTYVARTLPVPEPAGELTDAVDVPFGLDERLVLGLARRGNLKDSTVSTALERMIALEDAELAFSAWSMPGESPRVRRIPRVERHHSLATIPRSSWMFF